jgi:hypothetical protein
MSEIYRKFFGGDTFFWTDVWRSGALAWIFHTRATVNRRRTLVAQAGSLPYRRLAIGSPSNRSGVTALRGARRMPFRDTADYQSALQGCEISGPSVTPMFHANDTFK